MKKIVFSFLVFASSSVLAGHEFCTHLDRRADLLTHYHLAETTACPGGVFARHRYDPVPDLCVAFPRESDRQRVLTDIRAWPGSSMPSNICVIVRSTSATFVGWPRWADD